MGKVELQDIDAGYRALSEGDYAGSERIFRRIRDHVDQIHGDLGLARSYAQRHQFVRSEKLLKSVICRASDHDLVLARMQLGRLYLDWGREADALVCLEGLYKEGVTIVLVLLAIVEARLKHFDAAERYAREGIAAGIENAEEMLGDVLVCQQNWQGAVALFQRLYAKEPRVAGKLGISLTNLDRAEEAIPYLREGVKNGNLGCIRCLVSAYLFTGKYRNGLAYGDLGSRLGQKGLHGLVGVCHLKLGEYQKAKEELLLAHREHETFYRMHYQLGMCHYELGEYEDALKVLKRAIRHHEAGAWFASGQVNKAMKRHRQARACFRKSAEVEGELAGQASYELGNLCLQDRDFQNAEKYFQDSWLAGHVLGGVAMAHHLACQGRIEEALRWYRQVADVGFEDVLPELGEMLTMAGQFSKAREVLMKALEKGQEPARLGMALLCEEEGNEDEADRLFEEALEHHVPMALRKYGEALLERKDMASAIAYLTRAWEQDHDNQALLPLAYAYAQSGLPDGDMQGMRFLYVAEKMGCLKGKYSRQLKGKLAELMGR